ncbi:MAG: TIR domain-containing protein [Anaerolineales bacterium]|nr:TIR domain-containing protein [Anaerolineales bacterium]
MTDVFISYSRRDKVFTQKLVDALLAANRDVWADWNSIPAASDWDAEIKEGIEKTDTVLFLLSPEWIKSNECRKEMIHAIQHGKRLIPILYLMPDQGQEVPPELAKINWVYMRDTDNFDKAFETLQSAMDTDLDWIKTHTRVQVRAIEWDKKKRDNSFTLRGKDLTDGEQFISSAVGKSPEPTKLQGEYILVSRKDATRRQRITLAGITIALVVSIALGIVAWFQRQEAIKQARISRVGELSAQASSLTEKNFLVSTLLSIEAFNLSGGEFNTDQAKIALVESAQSNPYIIQYLNKHSDLIRTLAFSPDGKILASGSADNSIVLWDVATSTPLGEPLFGHSEWVMSVAFSPDGKILASGSADGTIILWDVQTRQKLATLIGHSQSVNSIAFSPNGKNLASGSSDNSIILWNIASQKQVSSLIGHSDIVMSVAFSPDGKTLASGSWDDSIIFWDVDSRQPIGQPISSNSNMSIAFSPDGKTLASGSLEGTVKLWDVETGQLIGQPLIGHTDQVQSVVFSPNGMVLASGSFDQNIIFWNIETQEAIGKPLRGHSNGVTSLAFSPDGNFFASGSVDKSVILWSMVSSQANYLQAGGHSNYVSSVSFNPDGSLLASGSWDNTILIWDSNILQPIASLTGHTDWVNTVAFSPDGQWLASGSDDNTIRLWDTKEFQLSGEPLFNHTKGVSSVAFSPDSKILASGSLDNTIILWDVSKREPMGQPLEVHASSVKSVVFSPDGKILASGSWDKTIILWDVETRQPIGKLTDGSSGQVQSVAFSPDGQTLASGSVDNTEIFLWDVNSKQLIGKLINGHTNGVVSLNFSPDGAMLVSGGADSAIVLWDMATLNPMGFLTGHSKYVESVAVSPDGQRLASGSDDTTVILWDMNVSSWIEISCQRAGRNFTRTEWKKYFPNNEYRKTCDQWTLESEATTASATSAPTENTTANSNAQVLKSGSSSVEEDLNIVNKTDKVTKVSWINFEGGEEAFLELAPGESAELSTFETHAWRFRDPAESLIYEYVATDQAVQEITINTDLTVTVK